MIGPTQHTTTLNIFLSLKAIELTVYTMCYAHPATAAP